MRRYRFRLEPVLRVRRIEQDRAQGVFAAAQRAVADAERALASARSEYAAGTAQDPPSADMAGFLREQQRRSGLAQTVAARGRSLEQAREDAETARQAWAQAKAKVGALERLEERQRAEHALAAVKEDDAQIDELVTSRFGRPVQ